MPDVLYLIGWNSLIAAFMAMTVWLVCRTRMLARRPAVCHGLWLLVLLKLVTPPILSATALPVTAANQSNAASATTAMQFTSAACSCSAPIGNNSGTPGNQVDSTGLGSSSGYIALPGFSLFVTFALWVAAARRFCQVRRLLRRSIVESSRAAELLRQVSRKFKLRSSVKLQVVDAPITPMLCAMSSNPAIILPRKLLESLDDDGVRSIFAHELAHFLRRDQWVHLFAFVVTTLLWWNPLVWFARRQLSAAAEVCCDAVALERLHGSRKSYAQTLLTVVDSLTASRSQRSALGIAFGESHSLRRRFEMIADANVKAHSTRSGWMLLGLGVAALMLVPARAEENPARDATSAGRQQATGQTSMPTGDSSVPPARLCCPS